MDFLLSTLSFLFLMLISSFVYLLGRKIKINYTILLVIVGLLLVPISKIEFFAFINDFKLTPDILFYVFLPVLLFEAAYNINYKELLKNSKSIFSLAIGGLLISTLVIASLLYFLLPITGLHIPFIVCLLFGAIISATDPVAVIAIFKSVGAPRRLTLIFEGESLFNDGTAVALFMVILFGVMIDGGGVVNSSTFLMGIGKFLSMLIGGIAFGSLMGVLFSKILGKIRNSEEVEIVITMISAHFTFILAELFSHHFHGFPISGVIATVISSIIIGNYGKYKITPRVEAHMQKFLELFAFIANSIVFILIGLTLSHLDISFLHLIFPITIAIFSVMIARTLSVYLPIGIINKLKLEEKIPSSWQLLLSWGSLRGALALMMALMIPGPGDKHYEKLMAFQQSIGWELPYSIKDFILVLVVSSIIFTLFIKAPIIEMIVKKLKINKLSKLENFEYNEAKILVNVKILTKLKNLYEKSHILEEEYTELKAFYEDRLKEASLELKSILGSDKSKSKELIKKAISLHALGIEKQYLQNLFNYNEIDENNFKIILSKIKRQKDRLEAGNKQFKRVIESEENLDIFEKRSENTKSKNKDIIDKFIRNRSREIISRKVIKELNQISHIDFGFDNKFFGDIIDVYEKFYKSAKNKKDEIMKKHKIAIMPIEAKLINKSFMKLEEEVINDLYKKEIITPKIHIKFSGEVEEEIYNDVKKLSI